MNVISYIIFAILGCIMLYASFVLQIMGDIAKNHTVNMDGHHEKTVG